MIVDTSAVVAVLNNEPDRERCEQLIASNVCELSSVSYLEASIVLLHRRGEYAFAALDSWIESAAIEIVPFTASQARLARNAYAQFGKGRQPAGLNFGDCAALGLALERDAELLYCGKDFSAANVRTPG